MAGKGLDNLSALVTGASQPPSAAEQAEMDADEEKLAKDVQKVLDFAEKVVGKNAGIFDLQVLIEGCAEALREQIRDEAEGEGDGG